MARITIRFAAKPLLVSATSWVLMIAGGILFPSVYGYWFVAQIFVCATISLWFLIRGVRIALPSAVPTLAAIALSLPFAVLQFVLLQLFSPFFGVGYLG
jgi:hypothetical protein